MGVPQFKGANQAKVGNKRCGGQFKVPQFT